jgi:hypothetical protein
MAHVVKDRVMETTSSTGTGTITLGGAATGFQSFSVIGNGNTTYYTIVGGTEWEVGIGTYTASGTTLSRDTVLESSNGGSLVNFSAGTKNVFVTYPAEESVDQDTAMTLTNKTISADNNTLSGIAASSFVLSNSSGNIDGSAAQKAIPAGVVVGTTDSQTLTNKTISGASNTLSNIGNSSLTNSAITINGTSTSLGGSINVGTVTSVGGTGSYGGLSLSGTVTSSGNITLGGTPTGTWPISVTGASTSCSGNAATATAAAGSGFFTQQTGSEGNIGCRFTGQSDVYMFNNASAWGVYSPAGGSAFQYTRGTGLFAFNGNASSATNSTQVGGIAANRIVYGDGAFKSTNSNSFNNLANPTGYYYGDSATGAPTVAWYNWMNMMGDAWQSNNNYGCQFAQHFWDDNFYVRRVVNGAWQTWRQLIHSGNIGSQSVNYATYAGALGTSQATTSGTEINFTGIPSSANRINVILNGVSTNGTSLLILRLGTSGGIVSSGYTSRSGYSFGGSVASNTTGATISDGQQAADLVIGQFNITRRSGNEWVINGTFGQTNQNKMTISSAIINLGGTLDRLRLTTVAGTNTFDAGSINILYE